MPTEILTDNIQYEIKINYETLSKNIIDINTELENKENNFAKIISQRGNY
jgi:hypothetical protein